MHTVQLTKNHCSWVTVDTTGGVVTIRDSHNVASVTYVSAGLITINFTEPFKDTTYSVTGQYRDDATNSPGFVCLPDPATAGFVPPSLTRVQTAAVNRAGTGVNSVEIWVMAVGELNQ